MCVPGVRDELKQVEHTLAHQDYHFAPMHKVMYYKWRRVRAHSYAQVLHVFSIVRHKARDYLEPNSSSPYDVQRQHSEGCHIVFLVQLLALNRHTLVLHPVVYFVQYFAHYSTFVQSSVLLDREKRTSKGVSISL